MQAPKPLKAFYGARAHDVRAHDTRAAVTRAHVGPGERPQEVFTPQGVLDVLYTVWGAIALDPCGHPDSIVVADEAWTGYKSGKEWDGPGLRNPWPDRTYWNPPFSDLRAWIEHAREQPGRWCGLFPARTHRVWCLDALLAPHVDGICWLRPVRFEGYAQANPDRLVLAYRGPDVAVVAAATPPELGTWTLPLQRIPT